MGSFSVGNISHNEAAVSISPEIGYSYYKIYWRKTNEITNQESAWQQGAVYSITGLVPGTSYTVNVGYNNTGTGGADGFMGAQTFTTLAPTAYIFTNGQWRSATPYIYTGGQWEPADANIYTGGQWHG